MRDEIANAVTGAVVKAAPPVAVVAGTAAGKIDMTWAVGLATLIYVVAQTAYLLWRWHRDWRRGRGDGDDED